MALTPEALLDAAVEHNLPPDNYFTTWQHLADWQIRTLKILGLQPSHKLLDIGCGAMRLGLSAVEYLESGNYFGVDPYDPYIQLAHDLAKRSGITKHYRIECANDLDFGRFQTRFDYAMAQSVITHLSTPQIEKCLSNLKAVMKSSGKFVFTYILGDYPTVGFLYAGTHLMQRGWLLDETIFETLAHRNGATFQHLNLDHPTGQSVGLITFH